MSQKYKLARSFEQSGDYENASRLYLELYQADKSNKEYFDSYVRVMQAQDKNIELLDFVEQHLKISKTYGNYILYGELLWLAGRHEEAEAAWEKALELGERYQSAYEELANTQINLRLFKKAIDTYLLARKNLDAPEIFSDRLSQLYSITGDYKNGVKEVIILFTQTRNLALAEGRLSALAINPEAEKYIYDILRKKAKEKDIGYKRLFAWFLTTLHRNKEALEINKEIDDAVNARGREVYNFAQSASDDGYYDVAIEAYQWVVAKGKQSPYAVSAMFRLAKTTELKFDAEGSLDAKTAEGIISRYRSIINDYPGTPTADECLYNIALLYKRIGKVDKALQALDKIVSLSRYSKYKVNAILLQGDIYFFKNDLNRAVLAYKTIVDVYKNNKEQYYKALYSLAEIEYFTGKLDSAIAHFTDLTVISDSDVANDALEKITLIEANKNLNKALELYAKGEKAEKQMHYSEALALFLEAAKSSKPENLYDISLVKAADMYFKLNDYANAQKQLELLLSEKSNGIYADYCMFKIAELDYLTGKFSEAIEKFTELLKKYPKSIYNDKARDLINKIRNSTN